MKKLNTLKLKYYNSLFLLLLVACHHPDSATHSELSDIENPCTDSLSVGICSDTIHRVSTFLYDGKRVMVLPTSWPSDSLMAYYNDRTISLQEAHRILTDTNIQIVHTQLPSLFVMMKEDDRDSIYKSKNQVANAFISLLLPDGTSEYEGEMSIKTRGSSSWKDTEKKPFTIKLHQSTKLLGLKKGKSFTLLNNKYDRTFIRNALAFHLSKKLEVSAPDFTYITLYLNGKYLGVYLMTNKIGVGKRSVDIVDLEKENKLVNDHPLKEYPSFSTGESGMSDHKKGVCIDNPDDITGGYILDYHGVTSVYETSISGFVSHAGNPIRIKSPKHASQEQVEYISDFYNQLEAAVMSPTGHHPETRKHYTEYLDMESFARYFILQEITQNKDGGYGSFMMYKDVGDSSKMIAGPAWDFDPSMRKYDNPMYPFNSLWSSSKITLENSPYSGGLLYWLWQHEDFQCLAKRIFLEELHPYLEDSIQWRPFVDSIATLLQYDAKYDQMRFPASYYDDDQDATSVVTDFIRERDLFLHWLWTADSSVIVTVPLLNTHNQRHDEMILYGNKIEGVTLPNISDSTALGYFICGTDSLVQEGTTLYRNDCVEIRWNTPNWFEVQYQRVKRKIKRLFH